MDPQAPITEPTMATTTTVRTSHDQFVA